VWTAVEEEAARKAFADRLNAAIKRRQVSHRQLAKAVQTSKQSVTNWTQGRHEPSLRYLRRLSSVLDVPVARLIAGETSSCSDHDIVEVVEDLADLRLRRPIDALRASTPALLDVLARAESQARGRRKHRSPPD
jgi:transcriptional regulator with XRE-family HTH domain